MKKIEQREPWKCLFFTFITCGLYGVYWQYKIMESISIIKGDYNNEFWKVLVLSMFTLGIYKVYWVYKNAKFLYEAQLNQETDFIPTDRSMMYMVFYLVTICSFPLALLIPFFFQKDINDYAICEDKINRKKTEATVVDIDEPVITIKRSDIDETAEITETVETQELTEPSVNSDKEEKTTD